MTFVNSLIFFDPARTSGDDHTFHWQSLFPIGIVIGFDYILYRIDLSNIWKNVQLGDMICTKYELVRSVL